MFWLGILEGPKSHNSRYSLRTTFAYEKLRFACALSWSWFMNIVFESLASHAVYTLIQCTPLLVEKAGVTPAVTFRITTRKQERVQARYPLWIWNPWGRTHKVQNRSNQWLHKMDLDPNKKLKNKTKQNKTKQKHRIWTRQAIPPLHFVCVVDIIILYPMKRRSQSCTLKEYLKINGDECTTRIWLKR